MIGLMLVYLDVLFTCDECGFNPLGISFYSKEWVQNLGTGCDEDKCKFWGHVKCLTVTVENIKNEFLCPEHKN